MILPAKWDLADPLPEGGLAFTCLKGAGVAFDALTDRTMDRNLFPIEMVIWSGISTPGILAGSVVGSLVYWIRKKLQNQKVDPIN